MMQSVRKMGIVPQELVEKFLQAQRSEQQLISDSPLQQLSTLDQRLKIILESNLPPDIKAKEYAQIFRQYSTIREKEVGVSQPVAVQEAHGDALSDMITDLPKAYMQQGKLLSKNVEKNPDLQWNHQNEIIYKGDRVAGSNMYDLLYSYSKPGKQDSAKPIGWKEFGTALLEHNVPRTAIVNKQLLEEATTPQQFQVPNIVTPKTKRKAAAAGTPKAKRKAVPKIPWTPY